MSAWLLPITGVAKKVTPHDEEESWLLLCLLDSSLLWFLLLRLRVLGFCSFSSALRLCSCWRKCWFLGLYGLDFVTIKKMQHFPSSPKERGWFGVGITPPITGVKKESNPPWWGGVFVFVVVVVVGFSLFWSFSSLRAPPSLGWLLLLLFSFFLSVHAGIRWLV